MMLSYVSTDVCSPHKLSLYADVSGCFCVRSAVCGASCWTILATKKLVLATLKLH